MNALLVLKLVNAVLASSPEILQNIANAKALIEALFSKGLITAEQQNALAAHVDAQEALHKAGVVPEWWQVQPDPQ